MTKKYEGTVCRGSWALGTACGRCERCKDTKPTATTAESDVVTGPDVPALNLTDIEAIRAQAYREGQESMRERCAATCEGRIEDLRDFDMGCCVSTAKNCAVDIRQLEPEDLDQ